MPTRVPNESHAANSAKSEERRSGPTNFRKNPFSRVRSASSETSHDLRPNTWLDTFTTSSRWLNNNVAMSCAMHFEEKLKQEADDVATRFEAIDENIFVAGQIASSGEALRAIQERGIKSVFNIRCIDEAGYVDLGNQLESHSLAYHHVPINYHEPRVKDVDKLMAELDICAKPCLIFCEVGLRAAAMGIAFKTSRGRSAMALKGTLESSELASDCACDFIEEDDVKVLDRFCTSDADSQLKSFVATYIAAKVNNCCMRPGTIKICDNVYLSGQLSEEELREFAMGKGGKSVLNLRKLDEAGEFGLGVLLREQKIVESLGLKYINVPVPKEGPYDLELCKQVSDSLKFLLSTASPVLVHCRTGGRAKSILSTSVESGLLDECPCKPFQAAATEALSAHTLPAA